MLERKYWLYIIGIFVCLSIWQVSHYQLIKTVPTFYTLSSAYNITDIYPKLPPDDYNRLIDKNDFEFLIMNSCDKTADTKRSLLLLVPIHTSPTNIAKRNMIRETWGQKRDNMTIIFLIGSVRNETVMESIRKENEMYGDIVQGNFIDDYRNMTYKHVMAFKYAIYHCPQAKYILKTDDDIFVNTPRMMDFIKYDLSADGVSNLLFCTPYINARAMRSFRSKWRISYQEYPEKYYPRYCAGWALLYSPDLVYGLYEKAQKHKYLWIDDVLITGILMKELHLEHTEFDFLTLTKDVQDKFISGDNKTSLTNSFLYGTPDIEQIGIKILWSYVDKYSQNRSVLLEYKI